VRHINECGLTEFAGLTLPPAAVAVAISLPIIIAAAHVQLLRRLDLRPQDHADAERVPKATNEDS